MFLLVSAWCMHLCIMPYGTYMSMCNVLNCMLSSMHVASDDHGIFCSRMFQIIT